MECRWRHHARWQQSVRAFEGLIVIWRDRSGHTLDAFGKCHNKINPLHVTVTSIPKSRLFFLFFSGPLAIWPVKWLKLRLYTKRLEPQLLFGVGAQIRCFQLQRNRWVFEGRGYRAGIDVREQRKNNRQSVETWAGSSYTSSFILKIMNAFMCILYSVCLFHTINKASSKNGLQRQIRPVDVCFYLAFASFYEELIAKRAEYSGEVSTLVLMWPREIIPMGREQTWVYMINQY